MKIKMYSSTSFPFTSLLSTRYNFFSPFSKQWHSISWLLVREAGFICSSQRHRESSRNHLIFSIPIYYGRWLRGDLQKSFFKLKYNWQAIFYEFWVYIIVTQYFYALRNDPHKSSYCLSPHSYHNINDLIIMD